MADKKSFVFYKSWLPLFEGMTDEQAGKLFKAICSYQSGEDSARPDDRLLAAIYDMIASQFAEDDAKYEETCQKRSEAGRTGGRPRKANETNSFSEKANETNSFSKKAKKADKDKEKDKDIEKEKDKKEKVASAPRFVKPTVAEVSAYCQERGNGINPESFVDFYESVGWKVGNKPMKDWKACVRTWEQRRKTDRASPKVNSFANFQQNHYTSAEMSELERKLLEN